MRLIGLTGHAGSGKDAVAGILAREHGFERVAFADPLRAMLYALNPLTGRGSFAINTKGETVTERLQNMKTSFVPSRVRDMVDEHGWDHAKREYTEIRELLQRMGTEAGRHVLGESIWVDLGMAEVKKHPYAVISDCRFVNEALAIKARGGEIWQVDRPGVVAVNGHISDTGLPGDLIDRVINNTGTLADLAQGVFEALTAE